MLASVPTLAHEWHEAGDALSVVFPAASPSGFDVTLTATDDEIVLVAGGFHTHLDDPADPDVCIEHALGLVRDLLSPAMRLREQRSNGRPYRWHLERDLSGEWMIEETMGLLLWNYVGRRSETIYQNHQLADRSTMDPALGDLD